MKYLKVLLICLLITLMFGCKDKTYNYTTEEKDGNTIYVINNNKYIESSEQTNLVKIDIRGYGIIIAELYPSIAEKTVENFKNLVSSNFYDNLIFHRVIKDFMIQTGDPNADGTGGSEKTIKGEFSANGIENRLSHTRGVLSMARKGSNPETEETMNSATSQFFIVHKDSDFLDGNYAAFGEVIEGIEIVDKIAKVKTDNNDKPINNIIINSIRFVNSYESSIVLNYKTEEIDSELIYKIEDKTFKETDKKTNLVKIEVKNYGIMIAELYPKIAPKTVENFKNLVSTKFYDNMIFHRVIKDFMIQTGDPNSDGTGGSEKTIKGEFSANGIENKLSHTRGVLSMARKGSNPETEETMNSATSQFFIVHEDSDFLDGNYAAFGKLLYGYDVLDKIANVDTDSSNNKPINPQRLLSIRFVEEGE